MEDIEPKELDARTISISKDKLAKFIGSARVWIKHLKFKNPCRAIDNNIIAQLKRDFRGEGCIREERSHRIPAVIESHVLQTGLKKLGLTIDSFRARDGTDDEPPWLEFEAATELQCLHGQHRVVAAQEYLPPTQRWWIVDLYRTDLDEETTRSFREGYSYSAKYTPGEIFRYIRLCSQENDCVGEQRWRAWLTMSQTRFLQQLLKRPKLLKPLDSLLCIKGVWKDFFLGSLDIVLSMNCDEEIANYLMDMKELYIMMLGKEIARSDPSSIESIQSRAPNLSKSDFDFIEKCMRSGKLFPQITDSKIRSDINKRLLGISKLIPSMHTLIKDIRYLKPAAKMMSLLIPKDKMSIRKRYEHIFEPKNHSLEIQTGVSSYRTIEAEFLDRFEISYRQLWLCSFRICKDSNPYGRLQLATLASRLGFSSSEIKCELKKDPSFTTVEKAVLDVLHTCRPNENFTFDPAKAEELLNSFQSYITQSLSSRSHISKPWITVNRPGEPLTRRCGHGSMDTLDLNHLFFDKIYGNREDQRGGDEISSFYVKRCRFIAFFQDRMNLENTISADQTVLHEANEESTPEGPNDFEIMYQDEFPEEPESFKKPENANTIIQEAEKERRSVSEYSCENQQIAKFTNVIFEENFDKHRIYKIAFDQVLVRDFARKLVIEKHRTLSLPNGHFFHWNECWETLRVADENKVSVQKKLEPKSVLGKRH